VPKAPLSPLRTDRALNATEAAMTSALAPQQNSMPRRNEKSPSAPRPRNSPAADHDGSTSTSVERPSAAAIRGSTVGPKNIETIEA
jgi:hypothetical protein